MITLNEVRQTHGLPPIGNEKAEHNMELHIWVNDLDNGHRRVQYYTHSTGEVSEYLSLCGSWFPPSEFAWRPEMLNDGTNLSEPTCESCILLDFEDSARSASESQQTEDGATYRPRVSEALQSGTGGLE